MLLLVVTCMLGTCQICKIYNQCRDTLMCTRFCPQRAVVSMGQHTRPVRSGTVGSRRRPSSWVGAWAEGGAEREGAFLNFQDEAR